MGSTFQVTGLLHNPPKAGTFWNAESPESSENLNFQNHFIYQNQNITILPYLLDSSKLPDLLDAIYQNHKIQQKRKSADLSNPPELPEHKQT